MYGIGARAISVAMIGLMLQACADMPRKSSLPLVANSQTIHLAQQQVVRDRIQQALQYEQEGEYLLARREWMIVLSVQPNHQQAREKTKVLQAVIDEQVQKLSAAGDKAFSVGKYRRAKRKYLAALALDPQRTSHVEKLREIHANDQRRVQLAKLKRLRANKEKLAAQSPVVHQGHSEENYYLQEDAQVASSEAGEESIKVALPVQQGEASNVGNAETLAMAKERRLIDEYVGVGQNLLQQGDLLPALEQLQKAYVLGRKQDRKLLQIIESVRRKLSNQLYSAGVRVYAKDLDQAIELWEKSVFYDAQHRKAKHRLLNAYKIKRKLDRLEAVTKTP